MVEKAGVRTDLRLPNCKVNDGSPPYLKPYLPYPGHSKLLNSCNEDDEHLIETIYYIHLKL